MKIIMKILILIFFVILNFKVANSENSKVNESEIFKNIRCLICQGQSIADSNSDFSHTIKLVVRDQIADGKSEKEIYNFLVEKYGQWIVYEPPFNVINLALWLLPYLVFVFGGGIIFLLFKKRENR